MKRHIGNYAKKRKEERAQSDEESLQKAIKQYVRGCEQVHWYTSKKKIEQLENNLSRYLYEKRHDWNVCKNNDILPIVSNEFEGVSELEVRMYGILKDGNSLKNQAKKFLGKIVFQP